MSDTPETGTKTELGLAIARGDSVASWALANKVPRSTAFLWAKDPEVRSVVEECRRRALDEAISRMTKHAKWAADIIISVAEDAQSDSVKLRAARAIFSDVIKVAKFSELEARITEFEEQLRTGSHSFAPVPPR
jgi:hypothetical protein